MADVLPGANLPIWGSYIRALHARPIPVKTITSGFILSGGQALAQIIVNSHITDWKEVKNYLLWGVILAPLNHVWQDLIAGLGPKNAVAQLFWDHLLWKVPIVYAFVCFIEWMKGKSVCQAWEHSLKVNPNIQKTSYRIWPIAQILNFNAVPLPLRVLYMNTCLFGWVVYLSMRLAAAQKKKAIVGKDD